MCPNEIVSMEQEVFGSTALDAMPGGTGCARYSVLQVLGIGHSASVYEVKSNDGPFSENTETFACKVINLQSPLKRHGNESPSASGCCGATSISDGLREASIMAGLDHPNLPSLRRFFVDEEGRFCIMSDVARGGTVLDALRYRGSFAEEDARAVMSGVLRALDHMHSRGIAHRDVKIENVLLVDEDSLSKVQLHDMGMAKCVGRLPRKCHTRCGTPLFVAPEMLASSSSKSKFSSSSDTSNRPAYGTQVDLWACGVMLYNLLSGYQPFMAGTTRGLWGQIVRCNYNFDDPVWHLISDDAKNLIQSLLVLDPEIRLTAGEALQHPWMRA